MTRLSIVHTESSLGWGGQELRVIEEAAGLIGRGHAVRIVCPSEARIFAEAAKRNVPAIPLPIARKSPGGVASIARWLARERPDVVNTHSSTDSWLAAIAVRAARLPIPLVRTRHISPPLGRGVLTRWIYGKAVRHVVTTGEALRREVLAATGAPSEHVSSVPTGIDLARFSPGDRAAARAATGLPQDRFIAGIVATLRSWKGHSYLLEALAQLPDPQIVLAVVGSGPGWENLHAQAADLGIAGRVVFAGQRDDVMPWLQALDLFVLPSYANEGVPQAIQQAMACGVPVITTPVGAIAEIVADGATGLLVAPRDTAALAAAIAQLKADPDRRARLGGAGRRQALERFSRGVMLERMEAIFLGVAASARARAGS